MVPTSATENSLKLKFGSVRVLVPRFRRFLLVGSAAHFLEALFQPSLGKKVLRQVRIVGARVVERLENSPAISRFDYLQRSGYPAEHVVVRV